jgi:hypothetical protein
VQDNYVKLLCPQARDLGKRDGRSSISSLNLTPNLTPCQESWAWDQVHVPWFANTETDPQVHLGAYSALAHSLLRRPLGSRDQGYRDRAAKPGNGIGISHSVGCLVGQLGVFIDDDDQRGRTGRYVPDSFSRRGEQRRACFQ